MKKFIGIFLIVIGGLVLLKTFYPEFYLLISPYVQFIKSIFWGVVLLLAGLYLISNNKKWRTLIGIIFVLYLALYLIVLEESIWIGGIWLDEKFIELELIPKINFM